jgi:flagellar biosynthetic protein FliQ
MNAEFVTSFIANAIKIALLVSAPMLLTGLVVGVIVSLFQTATSINEMTMTFVPKMLAVGGAMLFCFPWMLQLMTDFTTNLIGNIPMYIR